jgi:hypothetical protein
MTCGAGRLNGHRRPSTSLGNRNISSEHSFNFLHCARWLKMCVLSHDHLARTRSVGLWTHIYRMTLSETFSEDPTLSFPPTRKTVSVQRNPYVQALLTAVQAGSMMMSVFPCKSPRRSSTSPLVLLGMSMFRRGEL